MFFGKKLSISFKPKLIELPAEENEVEEND